MAKTRAKQPPQIPHDRLEHRLGVGDRAADRREDFAGRRLVLERYAQIVGALAQLVEKACVLDGDDSLGGEVLHQLDLLVGERAHFHAIDNNCSY